VEGDGGKRLVEDFRGLVALQGRVERVSREPDDDVQEEGAVVLDRLKCFLKRSGGG
jgi:hypothetical protein